MKRLIRMLGTFIPALALAVVVAQPAMAQDKASDAKIVKKTEKAEKGKAMERVLHEDDKVRVTETTFKPGDVDSNVARGYRVVRYLQGGTELRTYADGETQKITLKAGHVYAAEPDKQASQIRNVGKTAIVVYTVNVKGVK